MAMNNTYSRKVAANPTALNPNQQYIEEYDAMGELTQKAVELGQNVINIYAKAKDENERETTKLLVDQRQAEKQDALRTVQLSENPDTWEEEYGKLADEIDDRYKEQVPSRYMGEYNAWNKYNDQRLKLDLDYAKTKKTQDINRQMLFDRVERNAKNSVGIDAGGAMVLDDDTETSLKNALASGLINRAMYDKAMANYRESKVYNSLNDRLIRDPEGLALDLEKNAYTMNDKDLKSWKSKIKEELKINELKNKTAENNQIEAGVLVAMDMIKNQGTPPQTLLDQLPEKTRSALKKVEYYAVTGDDVPTDINTYNFLNEMRQNNPERFKNMNLYDYAGELSGSSLQDLREAQRAIVIGLDGKAKVNPLVKHNDELLRLARNDLKIKKDSQEAYDFDRNYDYEVQVFMQKEGRIPTMGEQEDILKKMRKRVAVRNWLFDSKDKDVLEVDADDEAYIPLDKIPVQEKNAILSAMRAKPYWGELIKLSDSEQERLIEDLAGASRRPAKVRGAAIDAVFERYLSKARKD